MKKWRRKSEKVLSHSANSMTNDLKAQSKGWKDKQFITSFSYLLRKKVSKDSLLVENLMIDCRRSNRT